MITNITEIQRTIRDYYKQLYPNKMDNLEEMEKFLEKHNFTRWNQEEIENTNGAITIKRIKNVIKILSANKPRTRWLHGLMFREELTSILSKLFQKFAEKGMTPNSFYKVTITVIPKPVKDTTNKENYRWISLIKVDAEILKKILANRIQQHSKKDLNHGLHYSCKLGSLGRSLLE